jgi:hypothetical protein
MLDLAVWIIGAAESCALVSERMRRPVLWVGAGSQIVVLLGWIKSVGLLGWTSKSWGCLAEFRLVRLRGWKHSCS